MMIKDMMSGLTYTIIVCGIACLISIVSCSVSVKRDDIGYSILYVIIGILNIISIIMIGCCMEGRFI